jgi:hypothetical protein
MKFLGYSRSIFLPQEELNNLFQDLKKYGTRIHFFKLDIEKAPE